MHADKNGTLEHSDFLRPASEQTTQSQLVLWKELRQHVDYDENGQISLEEFAGIMKTSSIYD